MGRSAFIGPDTKQVNLTGEWENEWVEVKKKLTFGEEQRLASASLTSVHLAQGRTSEDDTEIGLDMERHAIMRIYLWVTEWSLQDHTGRVLPVTLQNIKNLDPDVAQNINDVLDAHAKAVEGNEQPRTHSVVPATKSS